MGTLIDIDAEGGNGLDDQAAEWEEVDFLVDSGASATVLGEESMRAVKASEANRERQYKLADGSYNPRKGQKTFMVVTNEGLEKQLTASTTMSTSPC